MERLKVSRKLQVFSTKGYYLIYTGNLWETPIGRRTKAKAGECRDGNTCMHTYVLMFRYVNSPLS